MLILHNDPHPLCATINTALIRESPLDRELEHREKHENGHVALLGGGTSLCKKLLHLRYLRKRI